MKNILTITMAFAFLTTIVNAQQHSYLDVKVGSLVIDWNPSNGLGYGTQIGFGRSITRRLSLIGNFSISQASTFPFGVGESEETFFSSELGTNTTDNGINLPHRLHEHIMALSPFDALETNYHNSNYSSIGFGFEYDVIHRKKIELSIGILGIRQYVNELNFSIYNVWYNQGVITDYEYDVTLYQLRSWGFQLSNSVVWKLRPNFAITSNMDWSKFTPIKVGFYTNVLTMFSVGVRIKFD